MPFRRARPTRAAENKRTRARWQRRSGRSPSPAPGGPAAPSKSPEGSQGWRAAAAARRADSPRRPRRGCRLLAPPWSVPRRTAGSHRSWRRSVSSLRQAARGAAAAWPLAARAQQGIPRIALFMGIADDAEGRRRAATFRQALQQLGWKEGSTVRIDERWGVADTDVIRASAIELLQLNPSVIVVQGARAVPILQQATKTIPIVFVSISDPVGRGIVTNMARPGGNITGFQLFEFSMIGKLLEALKEVAPNVSRVACLVNPIIPPPTFTSDRSRRWRHLLPCSRSSHAFTTALT